jgi:hypothetical protein
MEWWIDGWLKQRVGGLGVALVGYSKVKYYNTNAYYYCLRRVLQDKSMQQIKY